MLLCRLVRDWDGQFQWTVKGIWLATSRLRKSPTRQWRLCRAQGSFPGTYSHRQGVGRQGGGERTEDLSTE